MKKLNWLKVDNILLGGLFLYMLIFTAMAAAMNTVTDVSYASAGAYASAVGTDSASTSTVVSISGGEITSSAEATAIASNGGTAQATADVWATIKDSISAHAWSIANAISGIGQESEAHAYASVTIYDGMATAGATATGTGKSVTIHSKSVVNTGVGNGGNTGNGGDPPGGNNNAGNTGNGNNAGNNNDKNVGNDNVNNAIIQQPQENRGFFGFIFCNSDVCAYSYFKHQYELTVGNGTKSDGNVNELLPPELDTNGYNNYIAKRAKYYMEIIASDRGLNESQFENKYKVDVAVPTIGTDRT